MSNEQLEQIEISIEQAQEAVAYRKALSNLLSNKNFEKIISKGYFESEASRLVLLKADPSMSADSDQSLILKSIDSIGFLRQYFTTIMQLGRMAERSIEADQTTREELLAEELH